MEPSPSTDARFRRLFDAHRDALQMYCHRRLGPDHADDALSEVFVVVWRKMRDVPDDEQALLWLYGIARNVVRNTRRSRARWWRLNLRLASLGVDSAPGPETQVVRRAEDQELLAAVTRLKPNEQELLRLRTWEELPAADIAAVTGLSVRAVETRLSRIRKKLAKDLDRPARIPTPSPSIPKAGDPR